MKRIWIWGLALVCVLFTGCGSLFAGDTRVELPTPPPEYVPSAKTAYKDMSQYDKYSLDGQNAFYISDYCSRDANDMIQFECLDYREGDCRFIYAYQAMLADGSGQMATEMLSYNPLTAEYTCFFSMVTDPSVEPAMWVQKMEGTDGQVLYFIYFGGTGRFYLPDGGIYREIPMRKVYMEEMEKKGGIEDISVLSVAAVTDKLGRVTVSMNLMGERVTVDENTEWTDEMLEDDFALTGAEEDPQVFMRIDFHIFDLSGGELVRMFDSERITLSADRVQASYDNNDITLEPGLFLGDMAKNGSVRNISASGSIHILMGGFLEQVEDIVEEHTSENEEGEEGTEEVVVGQRALMAPGSFCSYTAVSGTQTVIVPGKPDKTMAYRGKRFFRYRPESGMFAPPLEEERADSEILEAGYAAKGGFVFLTQYRLYFVAVEERNGFYGFGGIYKIPLNSLYKGINPEIDMTAGELNQDEGETGQESNPQKMEIAKIEGTAAPSTGAYGDAYDKSDDQLLDGLDPEAVDQGARFNQDSVEAGAQGARGYDRDQLEQDGLVMGDTVLSPNMDVNPEMYDAQSFLAYEEGLLVTSPGSGIVYQPFEGEAVQVFGYPMFRTWELSDGGFVSIGFDDNSKEYLQSDMPFAKVYYLGIE